MLTDAEGRPVAAHVYAGNTGDPTTVPHQVEKLRQRFGLARVVLVGDRGLLTDTQIGKLREHPGLGWISALRGPAIRALVESGSLQLSLFDEQNLAEICSPEYPGERLVACFNPLLAEERRRKRQELIEATEKDLAKIAAEVNRRTRTPLDEAEIALKAGRVLNRCQVGKHFSLAIADGVFAWSRIEESIRREAELDGVYVVRTSEPKSRCSVEDTVRRYKSQSQVGPPGRPNVFSAFRRRERARLEMVCFVGDTARGSTERMKCAGVNQHALNFRMEDVWLLR